MSIDADDGTDFSNDAFLQEISASIAPSTKAESNQPEIKKELGTSSLKNFIFNAFNQPSTSNPMNKIDFNNNQQVNNTADTDFSNDAFLATLAVL